MKVCLLSGRYPETLFDSPTNHKIYADAYGYTYIHCNWPTKEKNLYLNKIQYILRYIDDFEYIIWIDDDAFFFDFERDLMDYAPKGETFVSFCKSPNFKDLKTFLSSGQFILKCNELAKIFLNDVLQVNLLDVKKWWNEDLGYFSNGDQDSIIFLLLTKQMYKDSYNLFDYKIFNSRPENLFGIDSHTPLILHFTGRPDVKMANYSKVQKEFNLHSSLVLKNLLEPYHIVKKNETIKSNTKKVIKKFFRWLSS